MYLASLTTDTGPVSPVSMHFKQGFNFVFVGMGQWVLPASKSVYWSCKRFHDSELSIGVWRRNPPDLAPFNHHIC